MFWYARDKDQWGGYVFATRKLRKYTSGTYINFRDEDNNHIFVCQKIAERTFASKDMQLKEGEGPFKLEPLRRV